MKYNLNIDQLAGCLLGGALGDALGYPVEFEKVSQMSQDHDFDKIVGKLIVSDDTQMTLFTANALLLDGNLRINTWNCYQDWLETQFKQGKSELSHRPISWLMEYPEMYASREPGRTCLMTLMRGIPGDLNEPINQSKGCGALMRVAPLAFIDREDPYSVAIENSALTHGHQMSHIASAALVSLLRYISEGETLCDSVSLMRQDIKRIFMGSLEVKVFDDLLQQAILASEKDFDDMEIISRLGEGWVAEETLAIALYCSLKYSNDLKKALRVAVLHDGDSDSTGSVTGQILGTLLGAKKLPQEEIKRLDLLEPLMKMIERLS
ncbi:ADP-ribosylglycohydrolase family protein [Ligilactobacillus murinus]|uniref:ADP-ribosylglycohydrolase n=1 Tax=Ligilactobacillus murinus TaxID=1622 RepID=A0AAD0KX67_9LACO|nr:ADP-ribosylglycohydrolase family protein [Ligilactobacillus murinus]AWZ37891.1 ADP-ribosylglycohydrolase [Ligilactobacillus murinus]AWZ41118.1 ADP-ribosylglycohydrolase [Ligilactobacillus murinus]MCR1896023.1 ADP-ribosylglycohydrolase family protein [Ligilactobacillus murinus]HBV48916.1 ADP-ribosylglycohydrolase [Lactobacillus sp.]